VYVALLLVVVLIGVTFWPGSAPRRIDEPVSRPADAATAAPLAELWDDHVSGDLRSIDSTLGRLDGELESELKMETEE
ncbi:MAG TPA: hypothetical protein VGH74_09020, partial [Planctomycetaceae bacterium]